MLNPYELLYDAKMDIIRYVSVKDEFGYDTSSEQVIAYNVKCRYSLSSQSTAGSLVPELSASNKLFCGLNTDIKEGDRVCVTLRNCQKIYLRVGEVHPYLYQYQCRVEREDKA